MFGIQANFCFKLSLCRVLNHLSKFQRNLTNNVDFADQKTILSHQMATFPEQFTRSAIA